MIIGLSGIQGAGKDTVGEILINEYGFVKLSFASALKDTISVLFGWSRDLLEGATEESRIWRETVNEFWAEKTNIPDFTPRKALQYIGTDLLRNHLCKDIWACIVESKIIQMTKLNPNINIVITDCRFTNEFAILKKFDNARIVKVERDFLINPSILTQTHSQTHSSEVEWKDYPFDVILPNNGSIEELKDSIKNLIIG
jgi:hypothetical protein